jgi:3-oxoacyl-[acyl-carrier protein] reductase
MNLGLDGKVALVAGGSQGIGRATADLLAAEGCAVAICGRTRDSLHTAATEIAARGGQMLPIVADVTQRDAVEMLVQQVVDHFGRLDVLVNNVGASHLAERRIAGDPTVDLAVAGDLWRNLGASFDELTDDDFRFAFDSNLYSAMWACRAARPHLAAAGGGRIVMVSSTGGKERGTAQWDYVLAKMAVIGLARCLALEFAAEGTLVNCVVPGSTEGRSWRAGAAIAARKMGKSTDQALDDFARVSFPLGRLARSEEVAAAIVFLASAPASYISGAVLNVDGAASRGLLG